MNKIKYPEQFKGKQIPRGTFPVTSIEMLETIDNINLIFEDLFKEVRDMSELISKLVVDNKLLKEELDNLKEKEIKKSKSNTKS